MTALESILIQKLQRLPTQRLAEVEDFVASRWGWAGDDAGRGYWFSQVQGWCGTRAVKKERHGRRLWNGHVLKTLPYSAGRSFRQHHGRIFRGL